MDKRKKTASCVNPKVVKENGAHLELASIVDRLSVCNRQVIAMRNTAVKPLPSREVIISLLDDLRSVVFPRCFGPEDVEASSLKFHMGAKLDTIYHTLKEQINRGMCFVCNNDKEACEGCEGRAAESADHFLSEIPRIAEMMSLDVEATYVGDPAAKSEDEVIFCYPGITATLAYRVANVLYHCDSAIIARIISEYAHSQTGIDIHPGATIDERFMIDHGTGVVIGETCNIGKNVRIYQGVTLGAKSFPLDDDGNPIKGVKRHPNIEDDVIIYSGATLLGPIRIGKGAVIGGNVWMTEDVEAGTKVMQRRSAIEMFTDGGGI